MGFRDKVCWKANTEGASSQVYPTDFVRLRTIRWKLFIKYKSRARLRWFGGRRVERADCGIGYSHEQAELLFFHFWRNICARNPISPLAGCRWWSTIDEKWLVPMALSHREIYACPAAKNSYQRSPFPPPCPPKQQRFASSLCFSQVGVLCIGTSTYISH